LTTSRIPEIIGSFTTEAVKMATVKERKLIREITDLALDVNMAGNVAASVDINSASLAVRISPLIVSECDEWEWIYYPKTPAYFESESFDADYFDKPAAEFIAELKKHHPQFDADGVKL
jgi:hypothetical protein